MSYRLVPEAVLERATTPDLFFNLRHEQREGLANPSPEDHYWPGTGEVYGPLYWFIRERLREGTQALLLFQNYGGEELWCAVAQIERLYLDRDQYPQLRYVRPGRQRFAGDGWAQGIWGAFLIAAAPVRREAPIFEVRDDENATTFLATLDQWGDTACLPVS